MRQYLVLIIVGSVSSLIYSQTPGNVNNKLDFWIKANAETYIDHQDNIAQHNDLVERWEDQSGNGHNAFQFQQGLKAKFNHPQSSNWNFNPSVSFNGQQQFFNLNSEALPENNAPYNLFIVAKNKNLNNKQGLVSVNHYLPNRNARFSIENGELIDDWGINKTLSGGQISVQQIYLAQFNYQPNEGRLIKNKGAFIIGDQTNNHQGTNAFGSYIGCSSYTPTVKSEFFNGEIAEIIHYSRPLEIEEIQRVQSYLAVKYGITLKQQPFQQDYLASNNYVVYPSSGSHQDYNLNIAGIALDNQSGLHQKKSKSTEINSAVTIWKGEYNDEQNAQNLANDYDYLCWGNNGLLGIQTDNLPFTVNKRLQKVWRITEKNALQEQATDIGNITIKINTQKLIETTLLPVNSSANDLQDVCLLISNASMSNSSIGNFTQSTMLFPSHIASDNSAIYYHVIGNQLQDGDYFTFAKYSDVILNVTIENFKTQQIKEQINLNWESLNNQLASYYIVQRSINGLDWTDLTEVNAPKEKTSNFTYLDENPTPGDNYYRIEMLLKNNTVEYSDTYVQKFEQKIQHFKLYPNPTIDFLQIQTENLSIQTDYQVDILNMQGINCTAPKQLYGDNLQVDVRKLPPGVYILKITTALAGQYHTHTKQFVKK